MTTLYAQFNKDYIQKLLQVKFGGPIEVADTEEAAQRVVESLKDEPILGIDTETRPSFQKGVLNKVALLQIATHQRCYLFRLCKMGMPDAVKSLLADAHQLKVGLSLKDDSHALHGRGEFGGGKYVDLQDYVKRFGIMDMSLQKIYANVFRQRISKSQRLTNWEANVLTEAQKRYAATDAWACIKIYERLEQLSHSNNFKLVTGVDETQLAEKVIGELRVLK